MRQQANFKWIFLGIFIGIVLSILILPMTVRAEELMGKDYFAAINENVNRNLLTQVERYHFAENNFWQAYKERKYERAIAELKFVLRYFPNHPDALRMLGTLARLTERVSLPISFYENAIRLYPEYPLTHVQYGDYLVDIGLPEEGISKIAKAIEMDPDMAVAHVSLAKAYQKTGKKDLASREAQRARELGYKGDALDTVPKRRRE